MKKRFETYGAEALYEMLNKSYEEVADLKVEVAKWKSNTCAALLDEKNQEIEVANKKIADLESRIEIFAKGGLPYLNENCEYESMGQRHCDCCSKYPKREPTPEEAGKKVVQDILDEVFPRPKKE